MTLQFFANDSTYSGSTINIAADYQFSNPAVNTANHVKPMFILKALLKTCGWTVKSSGDGVSTYSTSSDILTMGTGSNNTSNGANTAGDFCNGSAWFYIQSPGTSSQHIVVQRPAGTYFNAPNNWRIKYSTTGFWVNGMAGAPVGSSGSATVTPTAISASDEIYLGGGGTDAAPTFTAYNPTTFTGLRAHIAANDQAPYGFWMVTYAYGSDPPTNGWYFVNDYMLSGTFPGNDQTSPDASPYTAATFSTIGQLADPTQQFSMAGAFMKNLSTPTNDSLPQPALMRWGALTYNLGASTTILVPQNCGVNVTTQKVDLLPIWYARRRDPAGNQITLDQTGLKGASGLMRFGLYNLANGEVFDYASTKDKVCFGFLVFDWNGTDIPAQ